MKTIFALLVTTVLIVDGHAQSLKQTTYIKPSNTRAGTQFGVGGTLLGDGVAVSGDGNTLAVGAPM